MRKKGNGFLRFVFSLLPGAGEMYMGFMKMGVSLMAMFFLIIMLASILELGPVMLIGVIVWFYGFFHVHNLASMPDDRFAAVNDDYLVHIGQGSDGREFLQKYKEVIAVLLIICGAVLLWKGVTHAVRVYLPDYVADIMREIGDIVPQIAAGAAVIVLGIYMIKGKAGELGIADKSNGGSDNAGSGQ